MMGIIKAALHIHTLPLPICKMGRKDPEPSLTRALVSAPALEPGPLSWVHAPSSGLGTLRAFTPPARGTMQGQQGLPWGEAHLLGPAGSGL